MRLRTFYAIAILGPLVVLAAVAELSSGERGLPSRLPAGVTTEWLYPTASVRSLVAYAIVAGWLLWELHRRAPAGFAPLLWFLPLVNTGVNILVLAPFILVTGSTRELFADEGLQVALRLVVRLLIGFGYVGLIVFTRDQLRAGGNLWIDD